MVLPQSEKCTWACIKPLKWATQLRHAECLPICLGHTLDLILLFDCVAVGGFLGAIDDLIGKTFGNGLDVAERAVTGTGANEVDGLVHATQWGDIHGLTTHHSCGANAGRILAGASILDGINVDLDWVLVCKQVDDFECMLHDANSHGFLAVVPAVHHHGAAKTLDNWAHGLAKATLLVTALGVGKVCLRGLLRGDVIDQTHVRDIDVLIRPPAEELDFSGRHLVFWETTSNGRTIAQGVIRSL